LCLRHSLSVSISDEKPQFSQKGELAVKSY